MNFHNLNFEHVEPPHQWPPNFQTSDNTPLEQPPTTALRPPRHHRRSSLRRQSRQQQQQEQPPAVRFDEAQLAMFATQSTTSNMAGLKDELTLAAGKVTPGVDDTPYIQYAIEAVTGGHRPSFDPSQFADRDRAYADGPPRSMPPPPEPPREPETHTAPLVPETSYDGAARRQHSYSRSSASSASSPRRTPISQDEAFRTLSPVSSRIHTPYQAPRGSWRAPTPPPPLAPPAQRQLPLAARRAAGPELWAPVTRQMRENYYPNETVYPPLTFKPRLLRPYSLMILILLCLLMVAGLVAATVYSDRHGAGLVPYPGTIYSGRYFVFRILPQFLGALILVDAQATAAASMRTLPFASMASEDAKHRYLALFRRLYPSCFAWPQPSYGPWQVRVFSVAAWLALFTVPLHSALFTCILVEGEWIWAPVEGVAWTLVALYLVMVISAAILMVFWFGRWTGLTRDVRSLADIITLLSRSNTTQAYAGADATTSTDELKSLLRDRWFDRLGYWRADDAHAGGIWYGVGASGTSGDEGTRLADEITGKRTSHDQALLSPTADLHAPFAYLPWCLRSGPLITFAVTSFGLLLALLIVSFLPQTRLERGFMPLLSARPHPSGSFSAANFLYSFLPSLLGMVLFLLLQGVDQALRLVQPWGELSRTTGGVARKTILADYAACCHPLEAAWKAARVGHWRVAVVSLAATLSLFIPVLAGGLFMALTSRAGQVRMFPNVPVYGVLLALLFLYVGTLSLLVPRRAALRLPHSVSCLAGVISLCSAEDLTRDAAFRAVRSRADLEGRLGVDAEYDARDESVWFLGLVPGRDEQRLSVRRLRRFTEKTPMMGAGGGFGASMV